MTAIYGSNPAKYGTRKARKYKVFSKIPYIYGLCAKQQVAGIEPAHMLIYTGLIRPRCNLRFICLFLPVGVFYYTQFSALKKTLRDLCPKGLKNVCMQ